MKTKELFVLVNDAGDGSYHTCYTFNNEWIKKQKEKDYEEDAPGWDADGFHYRTLTVPEECTLESLGIRFDCAAH